MNFMSNTPTENNTKLDLLVKLVDEDFDRFWHLAGRMNLPIYTVILFLLLMGGLLLWAAFLVGQPMSTSLFVGSISSFGIGVTLFFNSFDLLESNARIERFSRIRKRPSFKSINNERYEIILCSLIEIRNTLPISLQKTMKEMPEFFTEKRLLRYLLESR